MLLKHNYWFYTSALSNEFCDSVLALGKNKIEEIKQNEGSAEGWTWGGGEKSNKPKANPQTDKTRSELFEEGVEPESTYVRDSEISWLDDEWIYDEITPYVELANYNAGWNFDINFHESFQFTKYNPAGFYGWHRDGNSDHLGKFKRFIPGITQEDEGKIPTGHTLNPDMVGKIRKLSVTINIAEPESYEGGDLKFDFGEHTDSGDRFHTCEEIRPRGSIIVFPSFLPHCVTPVTKGTRYSLVLWSLGRPFR
tara:strand:+ start:109 stop:864 length:756 start_codon:yes stop_codon:yes gene_type:complete